jgi:predicted outer membrane repeat protein
LATNAGGGIFNEGALTVSNCTFSGNGSTDADGGAIFSLGSLTIATSTFSGNGGPGAYGGAVRNDGVLTVEQSTLAGNRADLGGAVYNVGTLIVNHSTLSGNTAVENGGGIANLGTLIAWDTILAGNTAGKGLGPDFAGALSSLGHNLIGNTMGGSGFVASDLLNINPLLDSLQDNGGPTQTMALKRGSPAIDAGDVTNAPDYDQRGPGYPRVVGDRIDIGAYEVQQGAGTATAAFRLRVPQVILLKPGTTANEAFVPTFGSTDSPSQQVLPARATMDSFFASVNRPDSVVALSQGRHRTSQVDWWLADSEALTKTGQGSMNRLTEDADLGALAACGRIAWTPSPGIPPALDLGA